MRTKQEAIADGKKYANMTGLTVYVLRRGNSYKVSPNLLHGWKVAEMLEPQNKPEN